MKHLKLCLIAVAALATSTFAFAEQKAMRSDATIASDINYLLYTPKDYAGSDKTYPLVVWLHGGDQGGSDVEKLRRSGLPKLIEGVVIFLSWCFRHKIRARNCFIRSNVSQASWLPLWRIIGWTAAVSI